MTTAGISVPVQATDAKRLATAKARAALRGIVLVESLDDRGAPEWIASLHAMTKAFSSLDDLERWLDLVEGKR
ncbi:MAG: hypothetical protein IV107_03930 [Paucibacter sp.]|nr:hypothetical protein [Roseateles sp.]